MVALAGFASPASARPAREDTTGGASVWALRQRADGGLEVVRFETRDGREAEVRAARMKGEPGVVSVEVDTAVASLGTDPMRPDQWALDAVSFARAWETSNGSWVKVAVVDTGVRGDHEDLSGAVVPGIDLVGGGDGRSDPNGHGTHVSGIIAARAGNGRGIQGGAPRVKILPVRVLDASGAGYSSDVAEGIIWAADHGARVINVSLGGTSPSSGTRTAIQYANSKGAIVLAAAGNGAQAGNQPVYPAAFPEAVAVAAIDSNRQRAPYSNYGSYVDVAAPGDNILSAWSSGPQSYAWASGTSMATPYASAAAALVAGADSDLDAAGIRRRLESTADDLGPAGPDAEFGRGLIDPAGAVRRGASPAPAPQPAPVDGEPGRGYWVVSSDGTVRSFGAARHYGDLRGTPLSAPIVASAPSASGKGYWLAGADGAVYSFGDARFHGSIAGVALRSPIVGMSVTPSGGGYFLLGADGGIFTFGDAAFRGSTGGMNLNAPVLDMTVTASGDGYWMVGADGGIFTFGDARFKGSTGNLRLHSPARSLTASSDGKGYWIVAEDGGIFAFGVPFRGSLPGLGLASIPRGVRIRALPGGTGYHILGADGAVFSFGSAAHFGSAAPLAGGEAVDLMLLP